MKDCIFQKGIFCISITHISGMTPLHITFHTLNYTFTYSGYGGYGSKLLQKQKKISCKNKKK